MSLLNLKNQVRQSVGTFTTNSDTFGNWLDALAGNTCEVTIDKKHASSDIVVEGIVIGKGAANNTLLGGVFDGSVTTEFGRNRSFSAATASPVVAFGPVLLSGLAAGSRTLTLQVRCSTGVIMTFPVGTYAAICAYEVNGPLPYRCALVNIVPSSTVTITAGSFQDLTDGTNPIVLNFTKADAASNVVVKEWITYIGNSASGSNAQGAVSVDGGADTNILRAVTPNTQHTGAVGERAFPGLAAGAHTFDYRAFTTVAFSFTSSHSAALLALEVPSTP